MVKRLKMCPDFGEIWDFGVENPPLVKKILVDKGGVSTRISTDQLQQNKFEQNVTNLFLRFLVPYFADFGLIPAQNPMDRWMFIPNLRFGRN